MCCCLRLNGLGPLDRAAVSWHETCTSLVLPSSFLSAALDPNILFSQESARSLSNSSDILSGNCKEQDAHHSDEVSQGAVNEGLCTCRQESA